jgi:two-component system response regulator NreC
MKEASPRSHVLVISEREGGDFARQLINAGAIAYLLKEDEPQALIDAIRRGKEGKPSVSARIAMAIAVSSDPQEETLTVREEEILKLIALGHTNAEVGELLHLSVRTVESHRANIMSKMGFGSRAELVSHALENEILKSG